MVRQYRAASDKPGSRTKVSYWASQDLPCPRKGWIGTGFAPDGCEMLSGVLTERTLDADPQGSLVADLGNGKVRGLEYKSVDNGAFLNSQYLRHFTGMRTV